jgi:phosphatidylethanolamine N-methyltransferase
MTAPSSPQGLRQRKAADDGLGDSRAQVRGESAQSEKSRQAHDEVVWGQTPDGEGRR